MNAYSKIVRHIYSYCFKNVHRVLFKMFNGYKNVQDIYIYTYFLIFFYFGFGYSMSIQLFTMFLNFVQYILHNVQCVFANCSTYFHKMFSTCPKILCMVNNIQIHVEHFFKYDELLLNACWTKFLYMMNIFLYTLNIFFNVWWTFFFNTVNKNLEFRTIFETWTKFENMNKIWNFEKHFLKSQTNFEKSEHILDIENSSSNSKIVHRI